MRKIIHIDMDCFYAAIEQRDNPQLDHLPIAVGGQPGARGVIATCNYEARHFGVHSAMPSSQALRLCPDLVFIRPNMEKYKTVSNQIRQIFKQYTSLVEPLSLDEAYLDISNSKQYHGSATWIAQSICAKILQTTHLTASAGVAQSKFLAKIASDWHKPAGLKVILPEHEMSFIDRLPVKKLHGVGPIMTMKLESMDIFSCKELRQIELRVLIKQFGKTGKYLFDLCRGIDKRTVNSHSARQSISVETTFDEDLVNWVDCESSLHQLVSSLSRRIENQENTLAIRKVYVKIKLQNFDLHSAESISQGLDVKLLVALLKRLRKQHPQPIRLLGIGVRFPSKSTLSVNRQLCFHY